MALTTGTYLGSITSDTASLAATITDETLDADVPTCPGWTLRDLAHHLGEVQRWARLAAVTGAPPQDDAIDPPPAPGPDEARALQEWLTSGARALVDAMRDLDPAAPTWHPFPVPKVAGVWPRRQAHEVAVHRWDAQRAVGEPGDDFPRAADFVAEYFEVIVPASSTATEHATGRPPAGPADRRRDGWAVDTTERDVEFTASAAADVDLPGAHRIGGRRRSRPVEATAPPGGPTSPLAEQWLEFGGN
ncbi:MAG: maleylpyruvate isomerase family mycothiol-dependent enzyme [Candidatus Nanopelagicales bacterium]